VDSHAHGQRSLGGPLDRGGEAATSAVLTSDDAYLDVEEVVTKVRACDKDGNGKIDRRELQGLLASICVQGVETAAEKEDVISQAAGGVTTVEDLKDKDGEPVKDIDTKDKAGRIPRRPSCQGVGRW